MKLEAMLAAIGGSVFGWFVRWLQSRESRLAAEAKAHAEVERERVKQTGETQVAHLREEHETERHALVQLDKERQRTMSSQIAHMECLAKVEHLTTRLELLERDHAGCPDRIERLEQTVIDLARRIARTESEPPPPAPAE